MAKYSKTESESLKAFGRRLKKYRTKKNFSQEALAEACGLHRTYIGSAERGERNVSLLNLERIAMALDLTVANLVCD